MYKRFIRIDPFHIIRHVNPYLDYSSGLYFPIDFTDDLLGESRKHLDIVLEKGREIYKECGVPSEYIDALVLVYLLNKNYERKLLLDIDLNIIVKRLSVNQYIEFIDRKPEGYFKSWYENIILNKDVIEFGLQQKFSDLLKNIKIDLEPDYKNYYLYFNNHYPREPNPDALYYINNLGQPIFVALESKFNKDYISTEIDIKNNRVKFNFRTYGSYYGEGDNSLVYQDWRYTNYVEVDLTEDKIVDHYE